MRRDNPVNKTQLVLTLCSCSKLEFNVSGGGVRQGRGEEKPFPLHCWTRKCGYLSPASLAAHGADPLGLLILLQRAR